MADPPGSHQPAAGDRLDDLLATKLFVPGVPAGFVPRPRLLALLDEALPRGLVVVCAPAGFGKTSLLAHWARHTEHPLAWLALDQGDNDPARLWRHAIAALDHAHPGIAPRVAGLLGPPPPTSFDGVIGALVNDLAARPDGGRVVLVLDDYHLIQDRTVHESVGFLLEHGPPGLTLMLASRADPPLPLARLRGRGRLGELRAADLRFTHTEAAALLREAVGPDLDLPDGALAVLTERAEGWAAGLQLAGLSLHGHADVERFVASFSGSHRFVLDFLAEEVLDRQPPDLRGFLLETSILERLSGPLCDAVTGRDDGQALLERVERANLFLVPLDHVRGWWRYHHLFADLLRVRLHQRAAPGRLAELHHRAAAWLEAHGLADDAIRHALAAREPEWAARLVERHADRALLNSERATLDRWLEALPAELVGSRPRLLLTQALFSLVSAKVEDADETLGGVERALERAPEVLGEPFEPSVGRAASLFANVPAAAALGRLLQAELRGEPERAIAFGHRALAETAEGEQTLVALIRAHVGLAEWLAGRLPEAAATIAASVPDLLAAGERFMAVRMLSYLGQVQRAQGEPDAALASYRRALEIAEPASGPTMPAAGVAHLASAEVAYQRSDLDTALAHLTEGIGPCRQLVHTLPLGTGLATLAWAHQARGDPTGALRAIDEALRVASSSAVVSLFNPVPAQRVRLLLAQGDLAAATRWTEERGLDADDQPAYSHEPEYLALTRVLLAQDHPERALKLLERLATAATAQGRPGSLVEIGALRALALAAAGDQPAALTALAEALALAHPQGYLRVFADEGAPMAALLGQLVSARRAGGPAGLQDVPLDYLGRLARTFGQDAERAAPAPAATGQPRPLALPGLVEPLTGREVEVLRLLAAGRPNQEIAEELVVTLSTVKKHVTHIFEKLGAANRTEATARARELGLLP